MGDELALIALLFRLKDSGPGAVSLLLATFAASRIALAPITGLIADRFPTRLLIITTSILQFFTALAIAHSEPPLIYLLVLLLAACSSVVGPAWQSFIAHVVAPDQLSRTYAFIQSFRSFAIVGGAGVGGFIVDRLGPTTAITINSLTFVVVAFLAASLRRQRAMNDNRRGFLEFGRGFISIVTRPVLRWSLVLLASFNMSAGVVEVLGVFVVTERLGGTAADYGLILAALGISMLLASLVLSRVRIRLAESSSLMASALTSSVGMLAYGLSPSVPVAVLAFFVNGIGLTGLHVFGTPILVRHTAEVERGRVFAASSSVTMGGMLIATGVAGAIGTIFPPQDVVVAAALISALLAVISGTMIRNHDATTMRGSGTATAS